MFASKTSTLGTARPVQAPRIVATSPCLRLSSRRPQRFSSVAVQAALKVGDKLTDSAEYFRVLRTNDGGSVALSNFKGKNPVVLFFYPKAGTPGCTKEVCKFRDEFDRFQKVGAKVFGISSDSPEENDAFAKAQRVQYPLLTDPSGILRKTWGIPADMMGLLQGRQTYVIDKDGKIVLIFNDQLGAEKHVDAALKALGA